MRMSLFDDTLAKDAPLRLPPAPRLRYLAEGSARIDGRTIAGDSAIFADGAVEAHGTGHLWRFEVTRLA